MVLSSKNRKELHYLYRRKANVQAYRRLFTGCAGEWTPAYLRHPGTAPMAARALDDKSVVLVLLREPVDRFMSAMRHYSSRKLLRSGHTLENARLVNSDATWGGFYATQLASWAHHVGAERMMVLQFEAVVQRPQFWANEVWQRLGLEPVSLTDVERPSRTAASHRPWQAPDGLEETLTRIYASDVRDLTKWGIDLDLWPRFGLDGLASGPDLVQ